MAEALWALEMMVGICAAPEGGTAFGIADRCPGDLEGKRCTLASTRDGRRFLFEENGRERGKRVERTLSVTCLNTEDIGAFGQESELAST